MLKVPVMYMFAKGISHVYLC